VRTLLALLAFAVSLDASAKPLTCRMEQRFIVAAPERAKAAATPPVAAAPRVTGSNVTLSSGDSADWHVTAQPTPERERARFTFALDRAPGADAIVTATPDVMNIGGRWTAIDIAPGQYGFATAAQRCTFTEFLCSALVQVSDAGDGTSFVSVTVTGSAKRAERALRDHFQIMFVGRCAPDATKE